MSNRFRRSRPIHPRARPPEEYSERSFAPMAGFPHPWTVRVYWPDKSNPGLWRFPWKVFAAVGGAEVYVGRGEVECESPGGCDGECSRVVERDAYKRLRAWHLGVPGYEWAETAGLLWPADGRPGDEMPAGYAGPVRWVLYWRDVRTGAELELISCGAAPDPAAAERDWRQAAAEGLGTTPDKVGVREGHR